MKVINYYELDLGDAIAIDILTTGKQCDDVFKLDKKIYDY